MGLIQHFWAMCPFFRLSTLNESEYIQISQIGSLPRRYLTSIFAFRTGSHGTGETHSSYWWTLPRSTCRGSVGLVSHLVNRLLVSRRLQLSLDTFNDAHLLATVKQQTLDRLNALAIPNVPASPAQSSSMRGDQGELHRRLKLHARHRSHSFGSR